LKRDFDLPKLNHPSVLSPLKASTLVVGNRIESQVRAQTPITQKVWYVEDATYHKTCDLS
jgi:hypothetical protein